MSTATQQDVIDGKACTVSQYPGMEGLKIWTNLVKLLGPSMAVLGKSLGGMDFKNITVSDMLDKDIDMDKMFSAMSEALVLASDKIDENIIEQMVLRILAMTKIDNVEITSTSFNLQFAGNYGFLFKVLAFTLKVNYSSFLGDRGHSTNTNQDPSLSSVPVSMTKT